MMLLAQLVKLGLCLLVWATCMAVVCVLFLVSLAGFAYGYVYGAICMVAGALLMGCCIAVAEYLTIEIDKSIET